MFDGTSCTLLFDTFIIFCCSDMQGDLGPWFSVLNFGMVDLHVIYLTELLVTYINKIVS